MSNADTQKIPVRKIGLSFVGEVSSLDLTQNLSDEQISAIKALVHEYGVLVVKGQNKLTDGQLAVFSTRFGKLMTFGPADQQIGIIRIGNLDENGNIRPTDHKYRKLNEANALWHIDNTFSEPPATYSMLLGRIIPSSGGDTEFADATAAYDSLSADKKKQFDGLRAIHSLLHSRMQTGYTDFSEEELKALPDRDRSLIFQHPDTGRKAIGVASHIRDIPGMSETETKNLLDELFAHVTQPKYRYLHQWEPGDLLIYDNRMVLHRAQPYPDIEEPRDLSALRVYS